MNETSRKMTMASSSSSSSAIVADKRRRSDGCVGIFFQLIDWNRRFTKKKLFPKKLLPPVQAAKRISKKFAGNEKMPKFLMIDKENCGGFPNTKKHEIGNQHGMTNHHNEMCAPSLVARLMGLESMPTVEHEKPRKAFDSQNYYGYSETSGSNRHRQDLNLDRSGYCELESRPQKLQRTVSGDGHPNTDHLDLGASQFNRNVPSNLRKEHHKLVTPVKSQRSLSKRSSARLMEAATKILEPGLHSRNRTKYAVTYTVHSSANTQDNNSSSLNISEEPTGSSYVSPCKSCGNLVSDLNSKLDEPQKMQYASSVLDCSTISISGDECRESKLKQAASLAKESRTPSLAFQYKSNMQSRACNSVERKPRIQNNEDPREPRQDVAPRYCFKQDRTRQNEMSLVRNNVNTGHKFYSNQQSRTSDLNGSTDSITFNRNPNNIQTKMAPRSLDSRKIQARKYDVDKKTFDRKRRSINGSQIGKTEIVNSSLVKQRNLRSSVVNRQCSTKQICAKEELQTQMEGDHASGSKDMDVVSFTFSAPLKHDSLSFSSLGAIEIKKGQPELVPDDASQSESLTQDMESGSSLPSQRETPLGGDAMNILLQEKIRELTRLVHDELAVGVDASGGRSTAAILEELISALTIGKPRLQKEVDDFSSNVSHRDSSCCGSTDLIDCTDSSVVNANNTPEAEEVTTVCGGFLPTNDSDQYSPISILEASFSNDSCLSESLNDSSENKPQYNFVKNSCAKLPSYDPETDLSDSASSKKLKRVETESGNMFMVHEVGLLENKPNYIREVVGRMELLFRSIPSDNCDRTVPTSIYPLLHDMLEALVTDFWTSPNSYYSSMEAKQGSQVRRILFDCIIEYLDTTYSCYCKSGYRLWAKLPAIFSRDKLTGEISNGIRRWSGEAGKTLDEIIGKEMSHIGKEMSHLTGKWLNFEFEAFEAGMEIQTDLLQTLVDEMVKDLL